MRGGSRPGAGRPKGAKNKAPARSMRQVTMRVDLWAEVDAALEARKMTRTEFFENAIEEELKK